MKFGICCSIENAPDAVAAGYDYVELGTFSLQGLDPAYTANPFAGLPVEATNLFFDGRLRLNGSNRTPVADYIRRSVERAANAGIKVMVIGSGGVRKVEGDTPAAAGLEAFLRAAELAQMIASNYGIQIAPESLNALETNVGIDLPDFIQDLATVGVGYTLDTYHVLVQEDGKAVDWAIQIPFAPIHVHLGGRRRDVPTADDPHLIAAAARLRDLGYNDRVSYEGSAKPDEYGTVLAAMRSLFAGF